MTDETESILLFVAHQDFGQFDGKPFSQSLNGLFRDTFIAGAHINLNIVVYL